MSNPYKICSTKIGNSAGFRLPAEFYREYPQFGKPTAIWIEPAVIEASKNSTSD